MTVYVPCRDRNIRNALPLCELRSQDPEHECYGCTMWHQYREMHVRLLPMRSVRLIPIKQSVRLIPVGSTDTEEATYDN